MPGIYLVYARGLNGEMGTKGGFPWGKMPLPVCVTQFRNLFLGKVVVMGRVTYESVRGIPLEGCKESIVLTRNSDYATSGTRVVHDIATILEIAKSEDVYVIGGTEMLAEFEAHATVIHLTIVQDTFPSSDKHFHLADPNGWRIAFHERLPRSEDTLWYSIKLVRMERVSPTA